MGLVSFKRARAHQDIEEPMTTNTLAPRPIEIDSAFSGWLDTINSGEKRHLVWLGIVAGVVLTVIGIRFLLVPDSAAHTFGLGQEIVGAEMHQVVAMRDLWLGLLAVAFAALREWRALGLWFVMGAGVCVADAGIVASTTAKWWALSFHLGSGVFCGWVGLACLRYARLTKGARG